METEPTTERYDRCSMNNDWMRDGVFSDPKDVKLVVRSKLTSRKTTHATKSIVQPRTQVSVEVTVYIYTYICI